MVFNSHSFFSALWLLFLSSTLCGQQVLHIEDYEEERSYNLQPTGADEMKRLFLNDYRASDLAFAPDWQRVGHPAPLQIRSKGGWRLYDASLSRFGKEYYDSIFFPSREEDYAGYCQVLFRGQRYLYIFGRGRYKELAFDEAHLREASALRDFLRQLDSIDRVNPEESFYFNRTKSPGAICLAFRQKDDWGQLQFFPFADQDPAVLELAQYPEVSQLRNFGLIHDVAANLPRLRRKHRINRIRPEPQEAYALYVQHRKSRFWGMAWGEGEMELVIPTHYDSIWMGPHQQAWLVRSNAQYGLYNSEFTKVLPVQYDSIEILHLDYTFAAAAKENDVWRLYGLADGKLMLDDQAPNPKALLEKWLQR